MSLIIKTMTIDAEKDTDDMMMTRIRKERVTVIFQFVEHPQRGQLGCNALKEKQI